MMKMKNEKRVNQLKAKQSCSRMGFVWLWKNPKKVRFGFRLMQCMHVVIFVLALTTILPATSFWDQISANSASMLARYTLSTLL